MPVSTYAADMFLNAVFRTAAFTKPTNLYLALHSADPGPTGTDELSGDGYARYDLGAPADASWNAPTTVGSTRLIDNVDPVTLADATATWTEATHASVWDDDTAGNMWVYHALAAPKTIDDGEHGTIAAGAIDVTMTIT